MPAWPMKSSSASPETTTPALALHARLRHDLEGGQVLDGPRRYLLMRADVLMGAFDRLPGAARAQALRALGASVVQQGGDSVRAYLAELGADALLRAMEDASASLGWGRWTLHADGSRLQLEVRNSPFAAATRRSDAPACHAIAGMLQALACAWWAGPASSRETRCACMGTGASDSGLFTCMFEAEPGDARGHERH